MIVRMSYDLRGFIMQVAWWHWFLLTISPSSVRTNRSIPQRHSVVRRTLDALRKDALHMAFTIYGGRSKTICSSTRSRQTNINWWLLLLCTFVDERSSAVLCAINARYGKWASSRISYEFHGELNALLLLLLDGILINHINFTMQGDCSDFFFCRIIEHRFVRWYCANMPPVCCMLSCCWLACVDDGVRITRVLSILQKICFPSLRFRMLFVVWLVLLCPIWW